MQFTDFCRFSIRYPARWSKGLLAPVFLLLVAACTPPEPLPLPPRAEVPFSQGRIWQVDREGVAPSYVFGTMHVSDPRVLDLPAAVEDAFAKAEIAAFETVSDDEEREELDKAMFKLPADETLEDLIGSVRFGQLRWHFKKRQRAPRNDVKPWVLWVYLGGQGGGYYDDDLQWDSDKPVLDRWLTERAQAGGKEVVALETNEEHFDIYDGLSLADQANLLKLTIRQYNKRKQRAPKVQYYVDGDLGMLVALWQEYLSWMEPETAVALDNRLIVDRNLIMVERMEPLLRKGKAFIAVGAAHLPREEGILRLLENRGFTVTRLH